MAGEKILVVEDNPVNMELVTDLLEAAGFIVVQAGTAERGIELARTESPALIFMDVALPGMDGLSATRLLKDDPATQAIPIVALTSHAMKGDEEWAMAAGCNGYLTKPIDTRTFAQAARDFIDKAK